MAGAPPIQAPHGRRVLIAGASGLVGRCLLARLCADSGVAQVHALLRRPLTDVPVQVRQHLVDLAALPALPAVDEVYLALGSTIEQAGSQAAFRALDFDANLAVAQAAQTAGARRAALVSALGANAQSRIFYNRVKGELEAALATLGFEALVIAQPSLLRGDRAALGQRRRRAEHWGVRADRLLGPLLPAQLRAIDAADVAAALAWQLSRAPTATHPLRLRSAAMQGAARHHPPA